MKKPLFWISGILGALVGFALVATVIGMFLPKQHSFSRSVRIAQPPETVWKVVTDFAAEPAWRLDVKSVERLPDRDGKETWKITTTHGSSATFQVTEIVAGQRLVLSEFFSESGPPAIVWQFDLAPADGGTRVTLHERGDFGNPYTRFIVRFVLGQTKFVDDYLTYLAQKFGQTATIE